MKRILAVFLCLIVFFLSAWAVKAQAPSIRPSSYDDGYSIPWYESASSTPVASDEWYLDPEIPLNYIPVPGEDELYMVVDDNGNITGYRHRYQLEDGSWVWEDVNPDIPDNYEPVPGLENVYKVTAEDGTVSYFLYVRNADDTYCFVPCDENGVPLDDGSDADVISSNYVHVSDNVYAAYNDDGVLMGYRERVEDPDNEGHYIWKVTDAPDTDNAVGNGLGSAIVSGSDGQDTAGLDTGSDYSLPSSGNTAYISSEPVGDDQEITDNGDGTYTLTDTTVYTSEENGYTVTYQEIVYETYDTDGNLLRTQKDGPYEIGRTASGSTASADKSLIAATLDAEYARVSAQVTFNTSKANEILSKLNAQRASNGLSQLTMNTNSNAYKIACIRAADMAIYDYSSAESPMYGTLDDLLSRYGIAAKSPSENVWKATTKTADEIHTRFQANEGSREVRMSSAYSEVGIAVVDQNGYTYIAEVYLGN